ncbi:hypothetical protein R6Q59_013951 [Mikania micrantha]
MSEETLALAMQRLSSFVDSMVKKADRSGHRPVDRSARRSKSLPKWGFFAVLLHRKVGEERRLPTTFNVGKKTSQAPLQPISSHHSI